MVNSEKIRSDFPILQRQINSKPLIYFDNAATSQKPQQVLDALTGYYTNSNANIHRGVHTLAEEATIAYESSRHLTQKFINASSPEEVIFTSGTTAAINLVAYSWGNQNIKKGDEIIVSALEHHSNLIPWQELAKRKEAVLKIIPLNEALDLDYAEFSNELLTSKTKLLALTGMSNVTGLIPDLKPFITAAHAKGAKVLIDGAQRVCHLPTDVQDLDCDFFTFSAHKMLGPTGVGILYAKQEILNSMPPFMFGGEMIKTVNYQTAEFAAPPARFEAGTPNIADVIAFQAAINYINKIGFENIIAHDQELLTAAKKILKNYPEVTILEPPEEKSASILSFSIKNIHPHDIASIFNSESIAIRSGHHCVEPLMQELGLPGGTARISFYIYNTLEEVATIGPAIEKALKIFK